LNKIRHENQKNAVWFASAGVHGAECGGGRGRDGVRICDTQKLLQRNGVFVVVEIRCIGTTRGQWVNSHDVLLFFVFFFFFFFSLRTRTPQLLNNLALSEHLFVWHVVKTCIL
jgi:hypothetical protein